MKFSPCATALFVAAATALALPSVSSTHAFLAPRAVSNTTLGDFLTSSVNAFFPAPGNDGWASAFDLAFSPDVQATFNDGQYDFPRFRAYFAAVKANLERKYQTFDHWFTAVVAVSSAQGGGYGIVTGVEGGLVDGSPVWGTDGAFAVIKEVEGQLKITEWREITNLGAPTS